jgi:small neutral amino acid transporter SnatA (MarC family)
MDTQLFTTFATSLFALLNPLGSLPVFINYWSLDYPTEGGIV